MSRDSLTLDDSPFKQFEKNKSDNIRKKEEMPIIEKSAEKHGFTKREYKSNGELYSHQFNSRCSSVLSEIINDIAYRQRLKKQDILELAILAFLEQNGLEDLLEKFNKNIINRG